VDEAMQAGSTAVWVQLEVADEALAWRTREAGLIKIMDRCPALEWSNC
jgi:predicted CoA-binding protein